MKMAAETLHDVKIVQKLGNRMESCFAICAYF